MHHPRRLASVVVVARRADRAREWKSVRHEADLAVLVFDVELERGQALALEVDVLLELAR